MKIYIPIFFIILFSTSSIAQEFEIPIEVLITQGYESYKEGDFETAIAAYKNILKVDPSSTLANDQIALCYFKLGDYDHAILYSEQVIQNNNNPKYVLSSYLTKGSSLDIIGETDASIDLFKEGIERFP